MALETVSIKESFDVHPGKLWEAITKPEKMRQWFFHQIGDFRAEKAFETEFNVEFDGKVFTHQWKIAEVVQGEKIVYDWSYKGFSGRARVTFKIYASASGSSLVLNHEILESFPSDEPAFSIEATKNGWEYLLSKSLKEYFENS